MKKKIDLAVFTAVICLAFVLAGCDKKKSSNAADINKSNAVEEADKLLQEIQEL